jgi:putative MFS transporter
VESEERSAAYVRLLFWLLIPAAFFNGFDGELRALLLPQIKATFHVSVATVGLANIPIAAGSYVAFFVVRLADRMGRRPLLLVSLFGYACFTGLTAASFSLWSFALFQSLSQIFLATEFALAVTVISEEVEPEHRGRSLGRLLIAQPVGGIVIALLLAVGFLHTSLGWRSFYLVGILPAAAIGLARRNIKETKVFLAGKHRDAKRAPLRDVFTEPWRTRVFALGAISFLQKIPVTAGVGWWVYYAEKERHLSTLLVSFDLATAFTLGILGYLVCGRAIDRFGRKRVVTVFFSGACVFGIALFQTSGEVGNFIFLALAVFFGLGISPALSALSAESFPTRIRAQAGAVVGNGFANTGELTGPALAGVCAASLGGIGNAVCVLTPLLLFAIPVLWRFVPETRAANLETVDDAARSPDATP